MKLTRPREAVPLSVWITFVLMVIGTVIYLTGLVVVDDITAFILIKNDAKRRRLNRRAFSKPREPLAEPGEGNAYPQSSFITIRATRRGSSN